MRRAKPEDSRPKRKNWAPGTYWCSCRVCEEAFTGDKRAIQCADCAYTDWEPTHQHRKTDGLYQLRHRAVIEETMTPAVVYEGQDGTLWVRPATEFFDGRFAELPQKP
jgi:hypothetical protein